MASRRPSSLQSREVQPSRPSCASGTTPSASIQLVPGAKPWNCTVRSRLGVRYGNGQACAAIVAFQPGKSSQKSWRRASACAVRDLRVGEAQPGLPLGLPGRLAPGERPALDAAPDRVPLRVVVAGEVVVALSASGSRRRRGGEVVRVAREPVVRHPHARDQQRPVLLHHLDAQRLRAFAAAERRHAQLDRRELAHREEVALEARRPREPALGQRGAQRDRRHVAAVRPPHRPVR